jgi:hypothetical protein
MKMYMEPRLAIDPQLQALCPPLEEEEIAQLEALLLAEGCRDPLVVWARDGAQVLVDGHHRYEICRRHGLPFTVQELAFASQEEVINWMIATQLGRRNLTPEQKSYLRGKRYNLEKRQDGGHGQQEAVSENRTPPVRERLAEEYGVAPSTISADGEFADAVDTLEDQVRADIRETILKRQRRCAGAPTKKQTVTAAKAVKARTVEPLPFMQHQGWKPYQVLEAITILEALPQREHALLNDMLDEPFIPGEEGLGILRNLAAHTPAQRQHIYELWGSWDPRDKSLAKTLAAKKAPTPDPQSLIASRLIREVDALRQRQRTLWRALYPGEPWTETLDVIDAQLAAIQEQWRAIAAQADALHKERIARYAEAFHA